MDIRSLDALDEKIGRLLQKLETMQDDRARLEREVNELSDRYTNAMKELDTARKRTADLEENQRDPGQEELIRSKIAALLSKLEAA
jgi:chromosome segregation ATPase